MQYIHRIESAWIKNTWKIFRGLQSSLLVIAESQHWQAIFLMIIRGSSSPMSTALNAYIFTIFFTPKVDFKIYTPS
jgi:hypothetical protein